MECVLPGFPGPAQNEVAISTGLVPLCTTPLHPGVMRKTPLVLEGALVPTALWVDKWMFKALEEQGGPQRVTWWRPNCQRPSVTLAS